MKRLLMIVFILVVCSALASAEGITVSGGLLSGNTSLGNEYYSESASGVGFYAAGEANVGPIAITGSYGGFGSDKVTAKYSVEEESIKIDTDTAVLSLLAGLKLPVLPFALGGGWVSQQWTIKDFGYAASDTGSASSADLVYKASGLALGAFGNLDFAGLVVSGKIYYVPAGTISGEMDTDKEEYAATGLGGEVAAAMQFTDNLGIEAGYRLASFTFKDKAVADEDFRYKTSGVYAGARLSF